MTATFRVDNSDLLKCIKTLSTFPKKVRNRAIRIGLNAAGGILKPEVISRTPVDMGFLRQTYLVKVKEKKLTKDWYLAVGSDRRKSYGEHIATKIEKYKGRSTVINPDGSKTITQVIKTRRRKLRRIKPSRYMHLANNGHPKATAHHFIEKALASKGIAATMKAVAKMRSEIESIAMAELSKTV